MTVEQPSATLQSTSDEWPERRIRVPGGSLSYVRAGAGDPILLIHGLGGTRQTWRRMIAALARTNTVIAPDLPGHGGSDLPDGDYSVGAHAAAMRDLLFALDLPAATVVGHSLGGGVALQFAYQFPERTSRLILLSSGGLGREVTPVLRAAALLPGGGAMVRAVTLIPAPVTRFAMRAALVGPGLLPRRDVDPLVTGLRNLASPQQRRTFITTARTVMNWRGQSVSALRKLEMAAGLPVLIVWGSRDRVIPPDHHREAGASLPNVYRVEIAGVGHFPQETAPDETLAAVGSFMQETEAFLFDEAGLRTRLGMPEAVTPASQVGRSSGHGWPGPWS